MPNRPSAFFNGFPCVRALLLCCVLTPAFAEDLRIDPHADLLYRQAVKLMEETDDQYSTFNLKTSTTDQDLAQQGQAMGRTLAPAVGLLEKAVALDHPVARYRLALYYMTYLPASQIPAAACPLLQTSLAQGFAPAALGVETWCSDYRHSSEFAKDLQNIPAMTNRYASYYPQPAVRLQCTREQPQGLAMQWGRQRDYQAEIYRLQGYNDLDQREYFWQKAVELNGCFAVRQHLLSLHH